MSSPELLALGRIQIHTLPSCARFIHLVEEELLRLLGKVGENVKLNTHQSSATYNDTSKLEPVLPTPETKGVLMVYQNGCLSFPQATAILASGGYPALFTVQIEKGAPPTRVELNILILMATGCYEIHLKKIKDFPHNHTLVWTPNDGSSPIKLTNRLPAEPLVSSGLGVVPYDD